MSFYAIEQLKAIREPLATNRAEALNVESTEIDGTDEVNETVNRLAVRLAAPAGSRPHFSNGDERQRLSAHPQRFH